MSENQKFDNCHIDMKKVRSNRILLEELSYLYLI